MELYKGHSISAFPGLGSSVEVMQPREPGKLTPSLNNPFSSRYSAYGPQSPPREIKTRNSLGAGFKIPRRLIPDNRPEDTGIEYHHTRSKIHIDIQQNPEFNFEESDNVLNSIEMTLQRLRQESQVYEQVKMQPATQSLFHIHSEPHENHPRYEEIDPNQPTSIRELEILRENHKAKLMQLEVEYMRKRRDGHSVNGISGSFGKSQGSEYWSFKRDNSMKDLDEKPIRKPSPERIRYEAKFEDYLKRKKGKKPEETVVGKPVKLEQSLPNVDKDKLTLLKWMFSKLDKTSAGAIEKKELIQEFHSNSELAELFGFRELLLQPDYKERLNEVFNNIGTRDRNTFTLEEFLAFFSVCSAQIHKTSSSGSKSQSQSFQTVSKPDVISSPSSTIYRTISPAPYRPPKSFSNTILRSPTKESEETVCLLTVKQMQLLESVFDQTDEHQDLFLKREQLIQALKNDERVSKILAVDAVRITEYQIVNLETMLNFIEQDGEGPDEFITWNQFIEYFYSKPNIIEAEEDEKVEDQRMLEIELPNRYLEIIKDLFESLSKHMKNKVSSYEFIQGMRNDSQIKGFLSLTVREPGGMSDIPSESLGDVLNRMERTAPSLISWNDVRGYLSKGGRPLKESQKYASDFDIEPAPKKSFVKLGAKKPNMQEIQTQTEEKTVKFFNSPRQRSSTPTQKPSLKLNRSFSSFEDIKQHALSSSRSRARSSSPGALKITVPQPFKFLNRDLAKPKSIRQRKVEEMVLEKEMELQNHLNYRYKPKPIPSEVVIPRYETIMATQEARRLEVKRTSMEMTKKNEKPFSFYEREKNKTSPQPESTPKYTFKAREVPMTTSVLVFDKMTHEDKASRDERIAKAAQESLRKSHLPPRMEMHERLKKVKDAEQQTPKEMNHSLKPKPVPNFTKLQTAFQKTLDAMKQAQQPTVPQPFQFNETKKKKKTEQYLDSLKEAKQHWGNYSVPARANSASSLSKPAIEPKITQKVKDMMTRKKQEQRKEFEKSIKQEEEEEMRRSKQEAIRGRVQSSQAIIEYNKKLDSERQRILNEKRREFQEKDEENNRKLKEMYDRVKSRPLMVETVTQEQTAEKNKMRTLMKICERLPKSVKPQDYFNEDELDTIEKAKYLISIGKLSLKK